LFWVGESGGVTAPVRQQDRSRATQRRLLDATVDCLVEVGWAGTTTTLVSERAGVSRGAQLHHYPTKDALVLGAGRSSRPRRPGYSSCRCPNGWTG
jgi:tetracycline repressor-like protein